jgi:hemolysin III
MNPPPLRNAQVRAPTRDASETDSTHTGATEHPHVPWRDHAHDVLEEVIDEVKPHLRGWLHAATAPLALVAGIVLVALSPTAATRFGSGIFAASALILFSVSATMHRGRWSRRVNLILRRLDHSSIFLLIAGTYTPFTLLLIEGNARPILLGVAWGGALLGIAFRILWTDAPRWLYTPIYIALGWASIFFADDFLRAGAPVAVTLLAAGGLIYTLGGVVYGLQRPNPNPSWFGFHEVFHTLTIVAFATQYVGVSVATYSLR